MSGVTKAVEKLVERFQVYDRQTGDVVGEYNGRKRAKTAADKKDNEYGAYRYGVRPVAAAAGAVAATAAASSTAAPVVQPAPMMQSIEKVYYDAEFKARHPDFVPEAAPAAPAKPAGKPLGEQTGRPDLAGLAIIDTLPALLKGAVAATLGLPGDLEGLVRLLSGGKQVLPTTEDVQGMLPPVVPADAKGEIADFRRENAKAGETIGEFIPVAPVAIAAKAVKTMGKKGAAKAAAGGAAAATSSKAGGDDQRQTLRNVDGGGKPKPAPASDSTMTSSTARG
jgi:hypothetical protein